ncbi:MAG TPA: transporter [Stellaceae bacterium]|jgi:hypothetical protein|nr:transporter [Stellaceae bacterium]
MGKKIHRWATFVLLVAAELPWAGAASAQAVTAKDFDELRTLLRRQQRQIDQQAQQLHEQSNELRAQTRQIQAQRRQLDQLQGHPNAQGRKRLAGSTGTAVVAAPVVSPSPQAATPQPSAEVVRAQVAENPEVAREREREQQNRIAQTNTSLARTGGVLTQKGTLLIEPSLEYDYQSQRQAVVSGFTIIPGITFGNINITKTQQSTLTQAMTFRYGVTDRLELNVRVPFVYTTASTTTGNITQNAQPITVQSEGHSLGDVEFGGSYQINSGQQGWPIFVGNLRVKTITGRDPFSVPIYTINDPNGAFLQGIQKETPTGTGFYSVEPSMTVLYPSDPIILFGNLRYIHNIPRTVNVQSSTGDAPTPTSLHPGDGIGANFGLGFAFNEKASLSLSYEEVHVFNSSSNHVSIGGSSYDLGTLNFGLGYQLTPKVSVNLSAGIGVTPDTPAAKILLSVPVHLPLFGPAVGANHSS